MAVVRDIMTGSPELVTRDANVCHIAKTMEARSIGAVIVHDGAGSPLGVVTDRDLAIEVLAGERDPKRTTAGDLLTGHPVVCVEAGAAVGDALKVMKEHAVRRLCVLDGRSVVGVLSQADLARYDERLAGELVEVVSSARDNTATG